jgi:lipoprotein-anchoring transpeptidase ErfK/SrfK
MGLFPFAFRGARVLRSTTTSAEISPRDRERRKLTAVPMECWFDWTAAWKTPSARALYMFDGNTLFRSHGTNEPNIIDSAASPGCIGTLNSDVQAVML